MSNDYIDLNRQFIERSTYVPEELVASAASGKRKRWTDILACRFAIVVAAANFGKTREMRQRAAELRASGEAAFFVALREFSQRGGLKKALLAEERTAFDEWLAQPATPITVFVDSLDEAAAGRHEDIPHLVSDLAVELSWPNPLVRWIVSSRPAMLTANVLEGIERALVAPANALLTRTREGGDTKGGSGQAVVRTLHDGTAPDERLRIFSMLPLDELHAARYLAKRHNVAASKEVLLAAEQLGLRGFISSPGGLDILANVDLVQAPPHSLTEVYRRILGAVQTLQGADRRLDALGAQSTARNLSAACRRLSAASQVCQLVNIEMPTEVLEVPTKALSARLMVVASNILTEQVLGHLLTSQLFIDTGFHQVKVYPDELAPYLAAEQLSELAQSPEKAHALLQHFSWSAPSGERGVYRQFLPMMGWLATLNPWCREEILEIEPQALAFFGDLRNPAVSTAAANQALRESIRRLVDLGDRLGRGAFTLTAENYWQAGAERVVPELKRLFNEYGEHYWAREALLNVARFSRSGALGPQVLRSHGNLYDRLLESRGDTRYVAETGSRRDRAGLSRAIKNAPHGSGFHVSIAAALGWEYFSPAELAKVLDRQFDEGSEGFYFSYWFEVRELLGRGADEQVISFARSIVLSVRRQQRRAGTPTASLRQKMDRYVEVAGEAVAICARRDRHDARWEGRVAALCLILMRILETVHSSTYDLGDLRSSLSSNDSLRRLLFSLVVRASREDDMKLWQKVYGHCSIAELTGGDVANVGSDRLREMYEKYSAARAQPQQDSELVPESTRRKSPVVDAKSRTALEKDILSIRDGSNDSALIWAATWLLRTNPNSRYGEVDIGALRRAAGDDVAQAVRLGFSKVWRSRKPFYKEDEPSSTYNITVAGLQGLHFELGSDVAMANLSSDEVRNALRYALFEINGYPKWFWPLIRMHVDTATAELVNVVCEANRGAVSRAHAEELLTSLDEAPAAIQAALAPAARDIVLGNTAPRLYVLERMLAVASRTEGGLTRADFEGHAFELVRSAFSPERMQEQAVVLPDDQERRQAAALWLSTWLFAYPVSFRSAVRRWGPRDPMAVKAALVALAEHVGADRTGLLDRVLRGSDEGVDVLGELYDWTMWAVHPADDINHPEGETYSVGSRDHAERFRDSLVHAIASERSQRAYSVLDRLRREADEPRGMYFRSLQFDMREEQLRQPPLAQTRYDEFERSFRINATDATSFALAVQNDILAVKYETERGDHSLRRFFSEVVLRKASSQAEGKAAGLALEADFQRLLASELCHRSAGDYSVTVEPHTAEAKRRDILCSTGNLSACIELKMSMRWNLEDYLEALEKQLVGQYMRNRRASVGFLVIVLQQKNRKWRGSRTGERLNFADLLSVLRDRAASLEAKDRRRYIRVIGIDTTTPDDFRERRHVRQSRSVTRRN